MDTMRNLYNSLFKGSVTKVCVSNGENRPRLDLLVNGQTINFLYDTGAIRTCITAKTYQQHFPSTPLIKGPSGLQAAGNWDLEAQGQLMATIQYQDKAWEQPVEVCNRVTDNLMGIELIHNLGLSYNSQTNTLFAIRKEDNWATTRHEVHFKPQSVTIITLRTHPTDKDTRVIATTEPGAFPTLIGGPALVERRAEGTCTMAITNVAPYEVTCPRGTPLVKLNPLAAGVQPTQGLQKISLTTSDVGSGTDKALVIRTLQQAGTREDMVEEIATELTNTRLLSPSYPKAHGVLNLRFRQQEPHYQKQTKVPEAYHDLVKGQINAWIQLGLVRRAESMFNTPLVCIQTEGGQQIVQDFRELNQQMDKQSLVRLG